MCPSKAAHRVGVMPDSSLLLHSFLVASLRTSRRPSLAALEIEKIVINLVKLKK